MPDFSDHAMIALYPRDPSVIYNIWGLPEGSSPDDYHITLMYLGEGETLDNVPWSLVETTVYNISQTVGPIVARLGCLGVFPAGEAGYPLYLPVDSPGVTMAHNAITNSLDAWNASEHGFTPHLTLGYFTNPAVYIERVGLRTAPVAFNKIAVVAPEGTSSFLIREG